MSPSQRVFSKADFIRKQIMLKLLLAVAILVFLGLIYTGSKLQMLQWGYEINDLKRLELQLMEQQKKLLVELSLLESPKHLTEIAENSGLQIPEAHQIKAMEEH